MAETQGTLLQALLQGVSAFCDGLAVFVVRGNALVGWQGLRLQGGGGRTGTVPPLLGLPGCPQRLEPVLRVREPVLGPKCQVAGTRQGNRAIRRNARLMLRKPAHGVCIIHPASCISRVRVFRDRPQEFCRGPGLSFIQCQVPGTRCRVSATWHRVPDLRRGPDTEHRGPSLRTG